MSAMKDMLFGGISGQGQTTQPQANSNQQPDWNALMGQLRSNPAGMIQNAGYQVPGEIVNDPQATVMHLLRTGQIGGGKMRMIQPLLNRMGVM